MADKFQIPESFKPINKAITTIRTGITIGQSQTANRIKTAIIKANITPLVDLFPDGSVPSEMFGTPVYDQVVLKKAIDSVNVNDVIKFDSVVVNVNQQRNIVRTPINGRNGTVKEYISDGDFDISIDGVITDPHPNRSPKEFLENLYTMLSLPNEIVIISDYLACFKIQYAVVITYTFAQIQGMVNQVEVNIKLVSDEPVELKLGIDPDA